MTELSDALSRVSNFIGDDLAERIFGLELDLEGLDKTAALELCHSNSINVGLFTAADFIKNQVSQINTVMHAVGVLALLPYILEDAETVESLSLGAGNTNKQFDLQTNLRVAEFEFSEWKGNDSARQTSLFEDFYNLAEFETVKSRYLYVDGTELQLKFLNSSRAIKSVLNRKNKIDDFQSKVGTKFNYVSEYYNYRKSIVEIVDIAEIWQSAIKRIKS